MINNEENNEQQISIELTEEMATGSVKKSTMPNEKNVMTVLGLDNEL